MQCPIHGIAYLMGMEIRDRVEVALGDFNRVVN